MKKIVKSVAIFSNLKPGGAYKIYQYNYKYLLKRFTKVNNYRVFNYKPKNLLHYLFIVIFLLPKEHKNLAKLINNLNDIIIIHHSWLTQSPYIIRYLKIPIIYICHEAPRVYYDKSLIQKFSFKDKLINFLRKPVYWIDKFNVQKGKNMIIVTNSRHSKNIIDKAYKYNSTCIYPNINLTPYLRAAKKRKYLQSKSFSLLTVGSISKHKNQEYLIESISKINISRRPKLTIVGNNNYQRYVKKLIKLARNLNVNLEIKSKLSDKQLVKEYLKADCFIYTPIAEPFGLVVLEAMATGLPIITIKNAGGFLEIISNDNAVISSSNNAEIFAHDIDSLLLNFNKRLNLSQNNIKYMQHYRSTYNMNDKIISIINRGTFFKTKNRSSFNLHQVIL